MALEQQVHRERHRLRPALEIAREDERRAQLAERAHPAQHRAADETRSIPIPPVLVAMLRAHIQRYVDNGVTTPALAIMNFGIDVREAVRQLERSLRECSWSADQVPRARLLAQAWRLPFFPLRRRD